MRTTGGGPHGNDIALYVQHDGEANKPFLRGGKLLALVDLFPKREVVIRAAVHACLERDTGRPVEHEVGYLHPQKWAMVQREFESAAVLARLRTMRYPRLTNVQLNCWVIPGRVSRDSLTRRTRHGCISQAPGEVQLAVQF